MSSRSRKFAEKTDLALNKVNILFNKIKENNPSLVFIVGAGVSMDEPTGVSSGKKFTRKRVSKEFSQFYLNGK